MPRKAKAASEQDVLVMRAIGEHIKLLREQRQLSPKEFGLLGGVSQAQQYRIEAGERVPDVIYAVKVASRLGTTVDGLLAGCTSAHPTKNLLIVSAPGGYAAGRDITVNHAAQPPAPAKPAKKRAA